MTGEEINRLSRRRYLELLAELECASGPPRVPSGTVNRRIQQRIPFHHTILMALAIGADQAGRAEAVRCRNLSSRGVGIFLGQEVKRGDECQVMFVNGDRKTFTAPATVARCRTVRNGVFEVGLRFDRVVDLGVLLPWLAGSGMRKPQEQRRRVAV
ncbi:MAG: PilZ domain-containing protein [Phycisphaeraceae bacterium]